MWYLCLHKNTCGTSFLGFYAGLIKWTVQLSSILPCKWEPNFEISRGRPHSPSFPKHDMHHDLLRTLNPTVLCWTPAISVAISARNMIFSVLRRQFQPLSLGVDPSLDKPKAKSAASSKFYQGASSGSRVDPSSHVGRDGGRGGNAGTFGVDDVVHRVCRLWWSLVPPLSHPPLWWLSLWWLWWLSLWWLSLWWLSLWWLWWLLWWWRSLWWEDRSKLVVSRRRRKGEVVQHCIEYLLPMGLCSTTFARSARSEHMGWL